MVFTGSCTSALPPYLPHLPPLNLYTIVASARHNTAIAAHYHTCSKRIATADSGGRSIFLAYAPLVLAG